MTETNSTQTMKNSVTEQLLVCKALIENGESKKAKQILAPLFKEQFEEQLKAQPPMHDPEAKISGLLLETLLFYADAQRHTGFFDEGSSHDEKNEHDKNHI